MAKVLKEQQGKVLIYNNKAFKYPEELQSVIDSIIDRSVTSIESSATSIGDWAFRGCKSLIRASFPNATSIGSYALHSCSSLTSASFPNVTSIGRYALYSCSSLTSIEIPKVTSLDDYALEGCSSLTSIEIPKVTSIGDGAVSSCYKLQSITIPDSVTSIGAWAFRNCYELRSITIPNGITSIGQSTFNGCRNCSLFDFRKATKVPTLSNTDSFYDTPTDKKIVVPDALYDEWITATNWSSTDNNIVSSIIKASDYEASL